MMNRYRLEPYDPLAKRRGILDRHGDPVVWIDYDDVSKAEADVLAAACLAGLNGEPTYVPTADTDALTLRIETASELAILNSALGRIWHAQASDRNVIDALITRLPRTTP